MNLALFITCHMVRYDRVHDFHRHGAEYIASADMSHLTHMKGVIDRLKLPMKVIHMVQILNGGPR
jgi:L-lactate dehydrogenase complex protein LldE